VAHAVHEQRGHAVQAKDRTHVPLSPGGGVQRDSAVQIPMRQRAAHLRSQRLEVSRHLRSSARAPAIRATSPAPGACGRWLQLRRRLHVPSLAQALAVGSPCQHRGHLRVRGHPATLQKPLTALQATLEGQCTTPGPARAIAAGEGGGGGGPDGGEVSNGGAAVSAGCGPTLLQRRGRRRRRRR
jgi:hypothetical protein